MHREVMTRETWDLALSFKKITLETMLENSKLGYGLA